MTIGSLVKVLSDRCGFQHHYGRIRCVTPYGNVEVRLLEPETVTLVLDPHEVIEVDDVFASWFSQGWLAA